MRYDAIAVYIMTNRPNGTLYIGVTSDLVKRVWEHKNDVMKGFTCKHQLHQLVWYEIHESMAEAIHREKRLKKYMRVQKLRLIVATNP